MVGTRHYKRTNAILLKHLSFLSARGAAVVADALFPPLCLSCDEPVAKTATLCPVCWKNIAFVAPPFCACCGAVFDVPVAEGTLCGACLNDPPSFRTARAAFLYDDASRGLVLRFKHGDGTHAAPAFAQWMARAAGACDADAVVPVPLHRWRLLHRRYNQSALLAQEIAAIMGKTYLPDALSRLRATLSQGHMKRAERRDNVRGAFAVSVRGMDAVRGRKILLVDDVLTTGATVSECARVLLKAGAACVDVVTLARVRATV